MPPFAENGVAAVGASLPGLHRSVRVPAGNAGFWRKLGAFAGPGYLVAVGYMDPGNWATDIAGGSAFGYQLLSVILISSLLAMLLQALSAKLGIVTGHDLAQACRVEYGPRARLLLWLACELAIIACDLAEVLGTAIALQLLFGLPLAIGVAVTALDVFLILALQRFGFRRLEAFIIALLLVIGGCFVAELVMARPDLSGIAHGFVPSAAILRDPAMLYVAVGILGATVMPHNLYLHSSIVQTRAFERSPRGKREAIRLATLDSSIALALAFFINAAILILAASVFHAGGRSDVAEIGEAYHLLTPMLGGAAASVLFGIALLASGQNSTITGTLAGQIVMEGFLDLKMPVWLRRIVTRAIAIVPAAIVAASQGDAGATRLLVLSQVVLSLQLPFAVVPLVRLTGDRRWMGEFANGRWFGIAAYGAAALVIALNVTLLAGLIWS